MINLGATRVAALVLGSSFVLFALPVDAAIVCPSVPPAAGRIIDVKPAQASRLPGTVARARTGDTIRLADGMYRISEPIVFDQPGITLRSASGNRDAVVLDGEYAVGTVIWIRSSNVTIADVTVIRAHYHPVHVTPHQSSITGTLLHNLRVVDGVQQFIKINHVNGHNADAGTVRCSSLEMTDAGRRFVRDKCYTGGIGAHRARGWTVYGNTFSGFWCSAGLSGLAIHFWLGSRDTVIDSNVIVNSARGIGFGLGRGWSGRSYADQPCAGKANLGHYGGRITNNVVVANDVALFESATGFDTGIALENACGAAVVHNTVVTTQAPRLSSIEWRFPDASVTLINNLVTHSLLARDGGVALLDGNVANATLSMFVDPARADVHLRADATLAIDKGAVANGGVVSDMDGDNRTGIPDVGADEFNRGALATVTAWARRR